MRGAQVVCHVSGYERLRAFTSVYEQVRAVTSSYERLRAVASVYEQLRAVTSVYEQLRAVTSVYEQLRAFTSSCERLRAVTSVYEHLRAFASSCERIRAVTSVYEQLRAFTSSCERLRAVASVYEQLRAFTSRYDCLRACSSAPGRVSSRQVALNPLFSCSGRFGRAVFTSVFERARSRLVAFSRVWSRLVAPIFFSCSDTFGHVRARLGVFFRHFSSFFVILRPKMAFSGMAGDGRLRHWLGLGGQQVAAHGSRAGRGMCKTAWYSFEIGMQLRQGRGCVRLCSAQLYYKIGAFAVPGNSRVHLRMGVGF